MLIVVSICGSFLREQISFICFFKFFHNLFSMLILSQFHARCVAFMLTTHMEGLNFLIDKLRGHRFDVVEDFVLIVIGVDFRG